jgi:hypothetical protein
VTLLGSVAVFGYASYEAWETEYVKNSSRPEPMAEAMKDDLESQLECLSFEEQGRLAQLVVEEEADSFDANALGILDKTTLLIREGEVFRPKAGYMPFLRTWVAETLAGAKGKS